MPIVYASREIILSAGSLDSPKLLLLSGVGPAEELKELGITSVVNLGGVGKSLRDHLFTTLTIIQRSGINDRPIFYNDPEAMSQAREQWMKDQTGPLTVFQCAQTIGYLKNSRIYHFKEFDRLDKVTQDYLQNETVPMYEILSVSNNVSLQEPSATLVTDVVGKINTIQTSDFHFL